MTTNGTCAVCGQPILILHGFVPTEAMVDAALAAYRECGRPEHESDHVEAMREALAAALETQT